MLEMIQQGGALWHEAELYRLKGQLALQKFQVSGSKFQVEDRSSVQSLESEAEGYFLKRSRLLSASKRSRWNSAR